MLTVSNQNPKELLARDELKNKETQTEPWRGMSFSPSEEESDWLADCMIGQLKGRYSWLEHGQEIQNGMENNIKTKNMGGDLILIKDVSRDGIDLRLSQCQ